MSNPSGGEFMSGEGAAHEANNIVQRYRRADEALNEAAQADMKRLIEEQNQLLDRHGAERTTLSYLQSDPYEEIDSIQFPSEAVGSNEQPNALLGQYEQLAKTLANEPEAEQLTVAERELVNPRIHDITRVIYHYLYQKYVIGRIPRLSGSTGSETLDQTFQAIQDQRLQNIEQVLGGQLCLKIDGAVRQLDQSRVQNQRHG